MNGMEMMLKAMGLQDAMKGVEDLVKSGVIQKITAFADDAEELKRDIREMRIEVAEVRAMLRGLINERNFAIRGTETQSGSDAGDSGSADGSVLRSFDARLSNGGQRLIASRGVPDNASE